MTYNGFHSIRAFYALAVTALCLSATSAMPDEIGQQEYMNYCASCHGVTAKGDGEVAQFLNVPTPALTKLAQQNNGEFPLLKIIHIIDGRTGLGPHGTLMPVWGDRFKATSESLMGEYGAEIFIRGKILSLATYLESIQE
jgi:mono/diheme cytochrome c family protein